MLKNYLKIAFRNLYINKIQTIIKTVGLGLALSISMVIFSWVKFELSYDGFHNDANRIYRLVLNNDAVTSPPGFKLIFDKTPEIEYSTRLFKAGFLGETQKVTYKDKIFTNDEIYYADDDFFNVFSFPLLIGNPSNVLDKSNAAVITEATAEKYFGNENPIGKTLLFSDKNELEVTGVMKNIPANSHFHFGILITMKNHFWWSNINQPNFGSMWVFPTYFKINPNTNIESVKQKIVNEIQSYRYKPRIIDFQKLKDIHLHSAYNREFETNGDITYIYLFSIVGILIIIMSCINYINLTTAQSFKRAKEIGIRKTVGAAKYHLIFQFVGESVVVSLIAFLFALILLEVLYPLFNSVIGVKYFNGIFSERLIVFIAFLFATLVGALTGLFPAIVLAKHNIMSSIKSGLTSSNKKSRSRAALVVFQFCISIILIASSLIIFKQMQYIQNKKLGFDKDQVLVINVGRNLDANKIEILKKSIAANANISSVAASSQLPTNIITAEGVNTKDGNRYEPYCVSVDKEFFKTMNIKIEKGANRINELTADQNADWKSYNNRFVVNQTFLKTAGINIDDIDNQTLIIRHGNMQPGPIIGVVDDFHFESLHNPIRPLVFEFNPVNQWGNTFLSIKINSNDISSTIDYVKQQWGNVAGALPFDYNFLDDEFNSLYKTEAQTGDLFAVFTIVSIFIIMLGLLGLIAFIANQKTKEIGIRKVLGASVASILLLLSKRFIAWVMIATIISIPITYYFMNNWLQSFAFRTDISWWIFALSGGIALVIALATVSFQAIKAAIANPVEALRYE